MHLWHLEWTQIIHEYGHTPVFATDDGRWQRCETAQLLLDDVSTSSLYKIILSTTGSLGFIDDDGPLFWF
jgi:hypothetical protein